MRESFFHLFFSAIADLRLAAKGHKSLSLHMDHGLRKQQRITYTIISNALKRRAQALINNTSTDPQWRAIIRYGLETNDPWLADLVRRADEGEPIIDSLDFSLEPQSNNDDSSEEKIEALAEIICRTDESAAALFVLMGTLENSTHPKLLANTAKQIAFTRCGESNS